MRLALPLLALLAAAPLAAQERPALIPQPPLAPDFAALPRLAANSAAATRINESLIRIDHKADNFRLDCPPAKNNFHERWIYVAFPGPQFIAFTDVTNFYCTGAAHPSNITDAHVYDLTTGAPVNWSNLLPATLLAPSQTGSPLPAPLIESAALTRLYLSLALPDASPDCLPALKRANPAFLLWPDAESHGLALSPQGFAHAELACADVVIAPAQTLETLGASPRLIAALRAP